MKNYDVVVIGGGPGGYIAAIRTSELGLKTALIEKGHLGGVCLNVGCIPSKSLLKNAEVARVLRKDTKTFGVSIDNLRLDYSIAVERSRKVSKRLNQGIAFLMKKNNIDVYEGHATFSGPKTIEIELNNGECETLDAQNTIIATGTHPIDLKDMEADGEQILNYRHAILQTQQPKSVVIIGGGAIGVEFATIWNSYGTIVTIVEIMPNLMPNEDPEAGAELEKSFKKSGIKVKTATALTAVIKTENGVNVQLKDANGETTVVAEQVLIAVGFRPNSCGIGLEKAGVARNSHGWITVDEACCTNVPGIYAIGDITGKALLAHVASAMGRQTAEHIAGLQCVALNFDLIPHATYSCPQVASVGLSEKQAHTHGIEIKIGKGGFISNGKALGLNENEGWVKLIVDAKSGAVLGCTMVGPEVSELLPEVSLAIRHNLTVHDIALNIHAHPTLSELIMETAQQML